MGAVNAAGRGGQELEGETVSLFSGMFGSSQSGAVREGFYEPRTEYFSHRHWAGDQRLSTEGFQAVTLATIGPLIFRCRIGKITMKGRVHK